MNLHRLLLPIVGLLLSAGPMRADITLLLEEPFGAFGGMTPTGHAAIYLPRICAATPLSLRRCREGEQGVVISRYHRIAGFDWIAIPIVPYLYAVERMDQVPQEVDEKDVAALRDEYRRKYLEDIVPDAGEGNAPQGDWIQLVGAAYDRTTYAFGITTTQDQDDQFIRAFNARPNEKQFNLLFHNCADFVRQAINFYYPRAIHRSFSADMGIMTPKQAAKCLVRYGKRHPGLRLSSFTIAQVPGKVPRSRPVRGVLESFLKSKRYILPLAPLAVLHPIFCGSLVLAWAEEGHFDPRRIAGGTDSVNEPEIVARGLQLNRVPSSTAPPAN
jgi:hypothetical protein